MRMCMGLSSLQKEHAMLSLKLVGGGILEEHWLLLAHLAMHNKCWKSQNVMHLHYAELCEKVLP